MTCLHAMIWRFPRPSFAGQASSLLLRLVPMRGKEKRRKSTQLLVNPTLNLSYKKLEEVRILGNIFKLSMSSSILVSGQPIAKQSPPRQQLKPTGRFHKLGPILTPKY